MSANDVLEILAILSGRGLGVWVAGGWGMDALIGEQTRMHEDLDLAIEAESEKLVPSVLEYQAFQIVEAEDWRPARVALRDSKGREIDLHPVRFDESGTGWQANVDGLPPFRYPPDQLTVGLIQRREVPCLGPQLQINFHLGYEPTERDRRDVAVLCERLDLELPAQYRTED